MHRRIDLARGGAILSLDPPDPVLTDSAALKMRALPKLLPLLAAAALVACAEENPGVPPPLDRFHYPVSLAWQPGEDAAGPGRLYVVNS
ncbi:MAG: hypothetical protein ACK4N5_11685, partial [Myxococcales bacterium]